MSLELSNVIIHRLEKNESGELQVAFREEPLKNSASTVDLVTQLHRSFNEKTTKSFAIFKDDSDFKGWLDELRSGEVTFKNFTKQAAERLKSEMVKYPWADSGSLVFAEYRSLTTEYLFIGVISSNHTLQITNDLNVGATDYLDFLKMDTVVRIDLTTYETDNDSSRYLTYLKGRVGRKVSDFFFDFLQADVGMNTKVQNKVLMQAVEDFCADEPLEKEEKQQYRKSVYDYCNGQLKAGEELTVKELSGELPTSESGSTFCQFAESQGYELEESFPVDRSSLRKLTKFVGSGGGISINFDCLLLGERVFYDAETDVLTIKGTPPNLRDMLKRRS